MSYVPFRLPLTGGQDRSTAPNKADKAGFWTLANMRQNNTMRGQLEQTPRFVYTGQRTQGTYWAGGSTTEPTGSAVCWFGEAMSISGQLCITQYCAFDGTTQLKALHRTTEPANTGPTKGCLLKVVNTTAMSVSLGGAYDIVIDGTATFKWRVNGGAYTTLVAINLANGNLIDGGAIHIYWLASTGFTVADTWTWTRTDLAGVNSIGYYLVPVMINGVFYYLDNAGYLLAIEVPTSGSAYVRSVGYTTTKGQNLLVYEGHLFVFGSDSTGTAAAGSYILMCDNTTFENFIATDVNEADAVAVNISPSQPSGTLYVLNGFVLQNRLFAVTTNGLFYSDYNGLPVPFNFKRLLSFNTAYNTSRTCLVTTALAYITAVHGLYVFDGATLRRLIDFTGLGLTDPATIHYQPLTHEVVVGFTSPGKLLVYQEIYGTFYTRSVDIDNGRGYTSLTFGGTYFWIGTVSRKFYNEDLSFAGTPVYDSAAGTAFATPTVVTQLIGEAQQVSETQPVYIAATPQTTASADYSVAGYIKVVLSWFTPTDGLITGSPTTVASAFWTSASLDGQISFPRTAYRYLAFQFTVTGTNGTKPPGQLTLQDVVTEVYTSKGVSR